MTSTPPGIAVPKHPGLTIPLHPDDVLPFVVEEAASFTLTEAPTKTEVEKERRKLSDRLKAEGWARVDRRTPHKVSQSERECFTICQEAGAPFQVAHTGPVDARRGGMPLRKLWVLAWVREALALYYGQPVKRAAEGVRALVLDESLRAAALTVARLGGVQAGRALVRAGLRPRLAAKDAAPARQGAKRAPKARARATATPAPIAAPVGARKGPV